MNLTASESKTGFCEGSRCGCRQAKGFQGSNGHESLKGGKEFKKVKIM